MIQQFVHDHQLAHIFETARPRLIRFCASLTGNTSAAEDLAQETLIIAWQQQHKIHDWHEIERWLLAIAQNVCKRWWRSQRREQTHILDQIEADQIAVPCDFEAELDRDELATLLDRALALLPPETREVLIQKYVEESPYAAIAERLGLSENAVTVRVHRGKLALRKLLATELRHEAAAFDLIDQTSEQWQPTRIWCPFCGQRTLNMRGDRDEHEAIFRCPDCETLGERQISWTRGQRIIGTLRNPKAILGRQIGWLHDYYDRALRERHVACQICGSSTLIKTQLPHDVPFSMQQMRGVQIICTRCGYIDGNALQYLALDRPETQQFWKQHPRIHVLPDRDITFGNHPAILTTFASQSDRAQIDLIYDAESLLVLDVVRSDA